MKMMHVMYLLRLNKTVRLLKVYLLFHVQPLLSIVPVKWLVK